MRLWFNFVVYVLASYWRFLICREMWEQSMEGMIKGLIMKTTNPPIYTYIAERSGNQLIHKVIYSVDYFFSILVALSLVL